MKTEINNNQNNILLYNNFQPLASILISKRICPNDNPESPPTKKKINQEKTLTK